MTSKLAWPEEYYSALEHFYWEPQHLGQKKNAEKKKSLKEVQCALKRTEVPLNHILNLFFALAPQGLVRRFFCRFVPGWTPETMKTLIRPVIIVDGMDLCQPDLLFEGEHTRVAIEIKVDAKISIDQQMKYAHFLRDYRSEDGRAKDFWLLYILGTGQDPGKFKAAINSAAREGLTEAQVRPVIRTYLHKRGETTEQALALTPALRTEFTRYTDFAFFLCRELESPSAGTDDGSETLRNLINGLLTEIERHGLIKPREERLIAAEAFCEPVKIVSAAPLTPDIAR